jgi:NAD-dependent dihydropyrimidine dehydrogenase PreA subunit
MEDARVTSDNNKLASVEVTPNLCKACQRCVEVCAPGVLMTNPEKAFNELGYQWIVYTGEGCTGCGVCFYVCPEPGGIKVQKRERTKATS